MTDPETQTLTLLISRENSLESHRISKRRQRLMWLTGCALAFIFLSALTVIVASSHSSRPRRTSASPVASSSNPEAESPNALPFCDDGRQAMFEGEYVCHTWKKVFHMPTNDDDESTKDFADLQFCTCPQPTECSHKGTNAANTVMYFTCQILEQQRICDIRNATDHCEIEHANETADQAPFSFPCVCPADYRCTKTYTNETGVYRSCQLGMDD